jgi:hypothetical protein
VRLGSLRRRRHRGRLPHWQNLDATNFLADVAHGRSVGTCPKNWGVFRRPNRGTTAGLSRVGSCRPSDTDMYSGFLQVRSRGVFLSGPSGPS